VIVVSAVVTFVNFLLLVDVCTTLGPLEQNDLGQRDQGDEQHLQEPLVHVRAEIHA